MSDKSAAPAGGIGIGGLLGCIFVTLKLCGVINWSWWWVTAPFWGGLVLVLGCIIVPLTIAGILLLVAYGLDLWQKRETSKLRGRR